eukprot:TRINITY_DN65226_c0_g1_i1.p1 TRINITY_DN65226_c0_g1~~TRINITY_DN65226_c0_g1_i1.p1  ORF type:complete len:498 (-),score=67.64 TRINITY_DN65226_c0_g1_i1:29-1396(-)
MAQKMALDIAAALGGTAAREGFSISGSGSVRFAFPVTDLAVASIGAAGDKVAALVEELHGSRPDVVVDRRLATLWFSWTLRPQGWSLPSSWDSIAGDYAAKNGWVRLHTNAAHHRAAVERVIGAHKDKVSVSEVVHAWRSTDLEASVVAETGCAAKLMSMKEWAAHPQGIAVASEPLIRLESAACSQPKNLVGTRERPLEKVKVLDCSRVLAGPTCTRFLADLGANVLRIDPPWWAEPVCTEEMTLGKRCAGLNLQHGADRQKFEELLQEADVLVHSYHKDALENLGLGFEHRHSLNPNLVDVSLNAYGWTGPWANRRGFDSLVQMSSGIAHHGMLWAKAQKPVPLPVQALDHATGYLAASAAVHALTERHSSGRVLRAHVSLARTAKFLIDHMATRKGNAEALSLETMESDFSPHIESTYWGPAQRSRPPMEIGACPLRWDLPAGPHRSAEAKF